MKRIFKYPFGLLDTEIKLPLAAQILKVDKQADDFYIWALIEDTFAMEWRGIKVIGTGHVIEENLDDLKYLNSIIDGPFFVWHVFEVKN